MEEIKVAVLVILYNHEKYITDCLKSVVLQKTQGHFSIDVIISDDCSTDSSLALVEEFRKANPDLVITVLKSNSRMGVLHNVMKLFDVKGYDYYALLDGDDFWNSDEKLFKQVSFLENNNEYTGSCHDALIQHQDEYARQILFPDAKTYSQVYPYSSELNPWDVLSRIIIPTSSIVFRAGAMEKVNRNYLNDAYSLAWKITLFLVKNSKFYYFNETWSTYRNHSKGVSKSNVNDFHQSHIYFLKALLEEDYYKHIRAVVYKAISHEYFTLMSMIRKSAPGAEIPLRHRIGFLISEFKKTYYSLKAIKE